LKLGFDFDGVICDISEYLIKKVSEKLQRDITKDDFKKYHLNKSFPDELSKTDVTEIIKEVIEYDKHPLIDGARYFFDNFYNKEFGKQINIITGRPSWSTSISKFMFNHFPDFKISIIHVNNMEKGLPAKKIGITHFVEDNLYASIDLANHGIVPIIFNQPWNKVSERTLLNNVAIRVRTWKEIEKYITERRNVVSSLV